MKRMFGAFPDSEKRIIGAILKHITEEADLQSFTVLEANPRRCDTMTLVIRDNFYTITLLYPMIALSNFI